MDCNMQRSELCGQIRWPAWADAIISAEQGLVEARRYDGDEGYPWCRVCEKWCSPEHITSRVHIRRKWWYQESRLITMTPIESSSALHSEACNAQGASNSVIHSNISQEKGDEDIEIIQQERVQHCSLEQGVRVPKRWVREKASHVPEQQRDGESEGGQAWED